MISSNDDANNAFFTARRFVHLLLAMQRARTVLSLILMLVGGLLGGCGILLLVPMIELIGTERSNQQHGVSRGLTNLFETVGLQPTLEVIVILFLGLVGAQALLKRQGALVNARLQLGFGQALRDRLFESVARCRWDFFIGTRRSDFMHVLTHDLNRVSHGTVNLLNLAGNCVLVAIHLALSVLISPWLTLAVLAATSLLTPLLMRLNRLASNTGAQLTRRSRDFYHRIEQQLAGMREIKSLGGETGQIESFRSLTAEVVDAQYNFRRANANSGVVFSLGSALLLSGLLLAAVNVFHVAAVELLVLVVIFGRLAPQFRQVQGQYQQPLHTMAAFESSMAMQTRCDAEREPDAGYESRDACQHEDRLKTSPTIDLQNVSFRYDQDSSVWALQDINLTIPANHTTALVGPSGAGKSTMADLLLGLLSPSEGQLVIDSMPLTDQQLTAWRGRIGYVPQETFLLDDSIRANLLLARPNASNDQLWGSLKAAADEFVSKLPRGLDTVIGDRGVRLSGGERQRIALARALLRQPAVLILDEATSNLDAENQARIQTALEQIQGALTVVVIAHRLLTIRHADRIVVLNEGRIVAAGRFDELVHHSDYFRALVEADGRPRRLAG